MCLKDAEDRSIRRLFSPTVCIKFSTRTPLRAATFRDKAVMTWERGCLDLPPHWFIRKDAVLRDTRWVSKEKDSNRNYTCTVTDL